jgi:hypothetical protein
LLKTQTPIDGDSCPRHKRKDRKKEPIYQIIMSSIVERPSKRQKKNIVDKSTSIFNNECQSASLLPLVQKFSQTQLTDIDNFLEIIAKIRSHHSLLEYYNSHNNQGVTQYSDNNFHYKRLAIHKLHRTLILYLGFLLGSLRRPSIDIGKRHEVFSSLILCLRDLYVKDHVNVSRSAADNGDEFEEVFILIPKILEKISSDILDTKYVSEANKACYEIMKSWLTAPVLLKKFVTKSTTMTLEIFLFSLLQLMGKSSTSIRNGNGEQIIHEFLKPLRSICDHNSEFQKLLDVAMLALQSRPELSFGYLSHRHKIFYWRCVSKFTSHRSEIADSAVDAMISYSSEITDNFLSRQVMTCIGEFIQEVTPKTHMRVMQCIGEIFLRKNRCVDSGDTYINENILDENLIEMLECFSLCMNRADAADQFLRIDDWETIFDILVCIATDHQDTDNAENAAIVVIPILKSLVLSDQSSSLLVSKSIEVLSVFISSQNLRIVEQTINLLFDFSINSKIVKLVASTDMSPDLIYALALVAPRNFIDEERKIKLAHIFSLLIHEMKNIHFLARRKPILAFLICLANGSYCETESRGQEISVCMLMTMATNSCNRRMLAKEPGLISSLIRYTRTTTDESVDVPLERYISRKEMKELIFLLAKAL